MLKNKENKIVKKENISDELFLDITKIIGLDVNSSFKEIPELISKIMNRDELFLNKEKLEKLDFLKKNILDVKLFLFKNIEKLVFNYLEKENKNKNSQQLALSFYFFKETMKDKNINNINNQGFDILLKNTNTIIDMNLNSSLFPNSKEFEILKNNENLNFKTGFEYEFWLKDDFFDKKNHLQSVLLFKSKLNDILNKLNLNFFVINKIVSDKELDIKQNEIIQNYLEIVNKKINSLSEMLITNELILKMLKNFASSDDNSVLNDRNE